MSLGCGREVRCSAHCTAQIDTDSAEGDRVNGLQVQSTLFPAIRGSGNANIQSRCAACAYYAMAGVAKRDGRAR